MSGLSAEAVAAVRGQAAALASNVRRMPRLDELRTLHALLSGLAEPGDEHEDMYASFAASCNREIIRLELRALHGQKQ